MTFGTSRKDFNGQISRVDMRSDENTDYHRADAVDKYIGEGCDENHHADCDGLSQEKIDGKWRTVSCECNCHLEEGIPDYRHDEADGIGLGRGTRK